MALNGMFFCFSNLIDVCFSFVEGFLLPLGLYGRLLFLFFYKQVVELHMLFSVQFVSLQVTLVLLPAT